jgi:pimeloyl-ACP methyl ester carboxylesterase
MAGISSRGYRISYQVDGEGPPLMLVCGFSQWADQWVEAGYVSVLHDRFRVVRVDPLGHGRSDKPHDPRAYAWTSVIDDLVAVADAEAIDTAIWWGFSRGAALLKDLAFLHPDRVRAVVIGSHVETFGAGDWPDEPWEELCQTGEGLVRVWAALGFTDPDEIERALTWNDPPALAAAAVSEEQGAEDLVYERYPVPVPLLSYKGSLEGYSESMCAFLDSSRAEQHEVAGANHVQAFFWADAVLAFVEPFLTQVTSGSRM